MHNSVITVISITINSYYCVCIDAFCQLRNTSIYDAKECNNSFDIATETSPDEAANRAVWHILVSDYTDQRSITQLPRWQSAPAYKDHVPIKL